MTSDLVFQLFVTPQRPLPKTDSSKYADKKINDRLVLPKGSLNKYRCADGTSVN